MDANAILHIYIDIDIDIHINIDKDISICKDRNIDFNKAYRVVLMCLGHRYQTRCPIFMIHNLISMVRIGTAFIYSLKVSRCLMLFLIQKKVNIRH